MSGVFTDKRNMIKYLPSRIRSSSGVWQNRPSKWIYELADQTTTSFRTNRGEQEVVAKDWEKVTYNPFTENSSNTFDNGHEFYTQKRFEDLSLKKWYFYDPGSLVAYEGPARLSFTGQLEFPVVDKMSLNDIKFYGAKAIASCAPLQPASSVSTLLGELLMEGLPFGAAALSSLVQRAKYFQSIGDMTLALKFGFEPLIREVVAVMTAVSNSSKIIEQYYRDSGRQIRRSFRFPIENSIVSSLASTGGYIFDVPLECYAIYGNGRVHQDLLIRKETWFSGAFLYHANQSYTLLGKAQEFGKLADRVLGTNITPEVLWELAPWSWLLDWKVNVGDAISNYTRFSDSSGLVLRYGYLMRKTLAQRTYTAETIRLKAGNLNSLQRTFTVIQKERYKATPFGFGLNPNTFSVDQWAILAALGLSKGGRALP